MISTHTHTLPFNFSKQVVVSLLFFGFLLTTSLKVSAQASMHFANRSHCDIEIYFQTCLGTPYNFTLPQNSSHSIMINFDIPHYIKGEYPGGSAPDIVRFYSGCSPVGPDETYSNGCYNNVNGIVQSGPNIYAFEVW